MHYAKNSTHDYLFCKSHASDGAFQDQDKYSTCVTELAAQKYTPLLRKIGVNKWKMVTRKRIKMILLVNMKQVRNRTDLIRVNS